MNCGFECLNPFFRRHNCEKNKTKMFLCASVIKRFYPIILFFYIVIINVFAFKHRCKSRLGKNISSAFLSGLFLHIIPVLEVHLNLKLGPAVGAQ